MKTHKCVPFFGLACLYRFMTMSIVRAWCVTLARPSWLPLWWQGGDCPNTVSHTYVVTHISANTNATQMCTKKCGLDLCPSGGGASHMSVI